MLSLYNSMSKSREAFTPRFSDGVKVFTCGPSIYRRPHIGNYRTFMYEDILIKYLEYMGYAVSRSIPMTDIEDKTISEARKKNVRIDELTGDIAEIFFRECAVLGLALPDPVPRSSHYVTEAADILVRLMEKGNAYRHGKDIYFDPLTFGDFGKLFGLDMSRWPARKVRFHRDTYPGTRWNRGDFILWHGYRDGDLSSWDTGIGRGRPSWNIQDPAVAAGTIGLAVDINCGGIDNIYRHHDYNIAVIESVTGERFANYYLHGAHLIVDGKTMSKSKGNIVYPEHVFDEGYSPWHLRFMLWHTHYRRKLNFTWKSLAAHSRRLDAVRARVAELAARAGTPSRGNSPAAADIEKAFSGAMDDDLSAGRAFDTVAEILARAGAYGGEEAAAIVDSLRKIDTVLGVLF